MIEVLLAVNYELCVMGYCRSCRIKYRDVIEKVNTSETKDIIRV